jgi:hypothetical protein
MIAGARGLRASRIVGLGAGRRADFDDDRARAWVEAAVDCALDLRLCSAALELPEIAGSLRLRVEIALAGAARAVQPRGAALALDLLVSPVLERSVHEALRSARPRGLQRPLPIRLPQAPLAEADTRGAPALRGPSAVPAVK